MLIAGAGPPRAPWCTARVRSALSGSFVCRISSSGGAKLYRGSVSPQASRPGPRWRDVRSPVPRKVPSPSSCQAPALKQSLQAGSRCRPGHRLGGGCAALSPYPLRRHGQILVGLPHSRALNRLAAYPIGSGELAQFPFSRRIPQPRLQNLLDRQLSPAHASERLTKNKNRTCVDNRFDVYAGPLAGNPGCGRMWIRGCISHTVDPPVPAMPGTMRTIATMSVRGVLCSARGPTRHGGCLAR